MTSESAVRSSSNGKKQSLTAAATMLRTSTCSDHACKLDRPGRVVKPSAYTAFARPIDRRRLRERFQHGYFLSYKVLLHGEKEFQEMIYAKITPLTSDCIGCTIAPYSLYAFVFPAT